MAIFNQIHFDVLNNERHALLAKKYSDCKLSDAEISRLEYVTEKCDLLLKPSADEELENFRQNMRRNLGDEFYDEIMSRLNRLEPVTDGPHSSLHV